MPNGLDTKVNGSGNSCKPGDTPPLVPTNGTASVAALGGADGDGAPSELALANLGFVEDLYFQFLADPASVDPTWRRYFQGLNGSNGNGASAAAMVPPTAFKRSIFSSAGGAPANASVGVTGNRI